MRILIGIGILILLLASASSAAAAAGTAEHGAGTGDEATSEGPVETLGIVVKYLQNAGVLERPPRPAIEGLMPRREAIVYLCRAMIALERRSAGIVGPPGPSGPAGPPGPGLAEVEQLRATIQELQDVVSKQAAIIDVLSKAHLDLLPRVDPDATPDPEPITPLD